jgi:serine/threonine protein kinase/tetratricopeptide (TPR) repeat protein
MTPERMQQIEVIFHDACSLIPNQRAVFLDQACADDETLRREVELLLKSDEQSSKLIEAPAIQLAALFFADSQPSSFIGQSLNHYQIISLLGQGGMGKVYQARDTKLDRTVALKILPADVATDAERLRRFVREAKAASALNHPHVATIHEIGEASTERGSIHFIVMEYVAGQSLAAKIKGQPLTINEVVTIGSQIADALDEAHRKGITHRDLKPANVMLNERGQVKVLDFGLAKITPLRNADCGMWNEKAESLLQVEPINPQSAFRIAQLTTPGLVMGTVPYMSPEQALGRDVDHRSDIFSLGVVLYEMATGKLPFVGANTVETLDRILHAEPEVIGQFNAEAPAQLERIVRKCLAKERAARYPSAAELMTALQAVQTGSQQPAKKTAVTDEIKAVMTGGMTAAKRRFLSRRWPMVAALTVVLLMGLTGMYFWQRTSAPPPAPTRSANTHPVNPAAYDEYLRGRFYTNRQNKADNETAITTLERAVAADPQFAAAQAELAQAYIWKLFLFTPGEKLLEEKAFMAMAKALKLDPNLGAAHLARGRLLWTPANHFPHEQAIQEYRRALTLDPSLDEARNQLALVYSHIGAFEPALAELQKAVTANPTNQVAQFRIGETYVFQGKYEQGLTALRQSPDTANPVLLTSVTATALMHLGKRDDAADLVEKFLQAHPGNTSLGLFTSIQALLAALAGEPRQAESLIQRTLEKGKGFGHFHHTAYNLACVYAVLKKTDLALKWLQAAADDGFPCYSLFENEPYLDSVKNDPRFIALLAKLKQQWEPYRTN